MDRSTNVVPAPSRWKACLITLYSMAVLLCGAMLSMALPIAAQSPAPTYRYRAVDLGSLGGPNSAGCVPECGYLNIEGTAIFRSDTAAPDPFQPNCLGDCYATLGVVFQNGKYSSLSPLVGGAQTFPAWIADTGAVAGLSENGQIDPVSGFPEFLAVLWRGDSVTSLGTLGGTSSLAWGVNDSNQVVGASLTATPETLPLPFFYLTPVPFPVSNEMHAFLWSEGKLLDLKTLGGPDSFAQFINASGQVAGISYTNSTPNATTGFPTLDPFLWENGKMKDLGTLGGTMGFATGINNQGHVIGQSNLAGDATYHPFVWRSGHLTDLNTLGGANGASIWINQAGGIAGWADLPGNQMHHAFLWQNGKMTDLGTVGTDPCSTAYGVNDRAQVVGNSGDGSGIEACGPKLHGFLWENGGPAVDLDTLFAPLSSGAQIFGACCIADGGEILGTANLPNGDHHAVLLIPCDDTHADAPACHASPGEVVDDSESRFRASRLP